MSDIPARIDVQSQSTRALRCSTIRETNILDHAVVLHDAYQNVTVPASPGGSTWSEGLNVKGYDRVQLYVDLTVGGGTTGDMTAFNLDVQAGLEQKDVATEWYDRYSSFGVLFGGTLALTPSTPITLDTSALAPGTVVRFYIDVESIGHYIRVRPSIAGASLGTNSRCYIRTVRDLS
jgi:hypothetical protein